MSVRERIQMIRLMEKLEKKPVYAMMLGIEASASVRNRRPENEPMRLTGA